MLSNEELDVLEPEEVLGGVGTALAVFAWTEEEEDCNPGEVADCNIYCGSSLGDGVQVLDDAAMEGPHSCWRIILLLVRCQLAHQLKK